MSLEGNRVIFMFVFQQSNSSMIIEVEDSGKGIPDNQWKTFSSPDSAQKNVAGVWVYLLQNASSKNTTKAKYLSRGQKKVKGLVLESYFMPLKKSKSLKVEKLKFDS